MFRKLSFLIFLIPSMLLAQATTGYHRIGQVLARAPLQSVNAQVVPYATIVLTNTSTGAAAAVYSDPLMTVAIPNSTLTADQNGNYDYYFALATCITETISSYGTGIITNTNVCSLAGGGVTSVSNSDSSLTISPTTGSVVASLNTAHANSWSVTQTFSNIIDTGAASVSGYNCLQIDASGNISTTGSACSSASGSLSGMTAGQVAIAGSATTITSSKALAGTGLGITTGPTTTTLGDCVKFADTAGTLADAGAACGAGGGGISGQTTNYLPLATSATASTTSSIVEQVSTTGITVHSTATDHGAGYAEGTSCSAETWAGAGNQAFCANSVTHTMDLLSNGGAASPICTASNGYCAAPTTPQWQGYTYVSDSTAISLTSPAMSVTAGELLVVSCRFGTGTTCTTTDSASNTYTPLTARINGTTDQQISWAIASTTASITFTVTQSASAAGLSLVAMHYSGAGTVADTSAGANSLTTAAFTTSQRTLNVWCGAVGALTTWQITNINGAWSSAGVSQSTINAANADQGCAWGVNKGVIYGAAAPITAGSSTSPVSTVLAFRY